MFARRGALVLAGALVLVGVVGIAAVACGTGGGSGDGDTTSTTGAAGTISHPTGPDQIVMQVVTGGGFVPIEYNYTLLPEFTLYGDGTVIVTGPTIAIYPGPALPNLQTTKVSEDVIQVLLSAAKEAGLFQNGVDYGSPGVADVPTTTIVINADGTTYRSEIYALGFEDGGGLTLEQQQARAAVSALQGKLSTLALTSEEVIWAPYEFSSLAVFSRPVDAAYTPDPNDVQPNRLVWPLADLATAGEEVHPGLRKVILTGDDLATLRPLLDQATQITLWESEGKDYNLWFRPLLPGEQG
jgi:hypothetical protein